MNDDASKATPDSAPSSGQPAAPKFRVLRLWPALLLVALMAAARFGPGFLEGGLSNYWMVAVFGPLLCCLLILVWWLTASRATWKERLFGFIGLIASLTVTLLLVHPTMRGPGTTYLTLPMGMAAFAFGALIFRQHRPLKRTGVSLLFASAACTLALRNEGMTGDYVLGLHWRWTSTPEQRLLVGPAASRPRGPAAGASDLALANPDWPGFRGAERAGHSRGPRISTNWSAQPPRQLWRIAVGPAWSSFAVAGKMLFTQEQRGPMETVACYDAETGREIWRHQIEARFDEPLGGPGPRATPTLAEGGLFVTGAAGSLLRLNPQTGAGLWTANLKESAGREVPMWGYAASPLVTASLVIVYTGGPGDKGLLAFDAGSGVLRWSAATGNDSYSSPQLNTVAGEASVLMLSNDGLLLAEPATGKTRLNYGWKFMNYRALQPAFVGDDLILLPTAMNAGTRAIRITKTNGQLAAEELWTSRNLKPDFTDLVTHQGFDYGNDGGILTCVDLKNGERKWKGGRYGKGQVLLIETSGLLLVLAEDGRVVLLRADPNEHAEVASFKALEGKTWNHPVLVGDRLYVRNVQEAAAYQLALESSR